MKKHTPSLCAEDHTSLDPLQGGSNSPSDKRVLSLGSN